MLHLFSSSSSDISNSTFMPSFRTFSKYIGIPSLKKKFSMLLISISHLHKTLLHASETFLRCDVFTLKL